jgi:hypothetical protein
VIGDLNMAAAGSQACRGIPMGMGPLGGTDVVFKRKYRWTFSINTPCGPNSIDPYVVKLAARPSLTIEETEINFLHGKMWIPGKGTWETITVTFYDIGNDSSMAGLYDWLATVYDFTDPICLNQSSKRGNGRSGGYSGEVTLTLYDGCGTPMEAWKLGNCWPQAVNFGELDYSSSEEVNIETTLRYSEVQYTNYCGPQIQGCCAGC